MCICVKSCFAIIFSLTETFWCNDCIENCHLRWLLTHVIICLSCTSFTLEAALHLSNFSKAFSMLNAI